MPYRMAASDILAAWESGAARRPLDRALTVLWIAGAANDAHPADLPLAERDRRLLTVRADTFGRMLPVLATCPECGAELEMELDSRRLADALRSTGDDAAPRPLTSRDLAAIAELAPEDLAAALRMRVADDGTDVADAEVLDRRIEDGARATELSTQTTCAACSAEWTETLDVLAHIWADVETTALALLGEVAEIATAYGWSEAEILSLSPERRSAYLSLARPS